MTSSYILFLPHFYFTFTLHIGYTLYLLKCVMKLEGGPTKGLLWLKVEDVFAVL